jgi:hypothetical protein
MTASAKTFVHKAILQKVQPAAALFSTAHCIYLRHTVRLSTKLWELARFAQVPVMTQGSAVQPGYDGSMYFPGATGTLVRLTPASVDGWDGGPQP